MPSMESFLLAKLDLSSARSCIIQKSCFVQVRVYSFKLGWSLGFKEKIRLRNSVKIEMVQNGGVRYAIVRNAANSELGNQVESSHSGDDPRLSNCLVMKENETRLIKRVAVIGAGFSGVAACKTLVASGITNVTVFESENKVGGIWASTYPSTTLQSPKTTYRFSDFDWPEDVPQNPTHSHVIDYINNYVAKFDLLKRIEFGSRVLKLSVSNHGWNVLFQRNGESEWKEFDFVVNCSGCFSGVPKMPNLNYEAFGGTVLHTLDYSLLSEQERIQLLRGKKVTVVGFQKSAIDVVLEVVNINSGHGSSPVTLLFRRPHWFVPPSQLVFGIRLKWLTSTRFSQIFVAKPGQSFLQTVLQTIVPLRQIVTALVEFYLSWSYSLKKYDLVPSHSFFEDLSACVLPQMPSEFLAFVDSADIRLVRSKTFNLAGDGIDTGDGTRIESDVVILCTGYDGLSKIRKILPEEFARVLTENGRKNISLYRGVIHPHIPRMAFLGFHEGLSSIQTSEMGSRWLSKLLLGKFSLPSVEEMDRDRFSFSDLKAEQSSFSDRVSCVVPMQSWHFDQLCRDMGWRTMRKKDFFANWFTAHTNADYVELEEDMDNK